MNAPINIARPLARVLFAPTPDEPIVEHAVYYATNNDWHVFPVPLGTKRSHKSAEHSDGRPWGATTEADEIRRDFKRWPDANVGIVMGGVSGVFVVETDTAEGHGEGVDGDASLKALEAKHGALPPTLEAISPSGSVHRYFNHPGPGIKVVSRSIASGIDCKGDGGMVIAPPSVKPGKGAYSWRNDLPIADAPQWLLDLVVTNPKPELTLSQQTTALVRPPADYVDPYAEYGATGIHCSDGYSRAYLDTALDGERAIVVGAGKGGRNIQLNKSSFALGQLVAHGLTEKEVIDTMYDAAKACGHLEDEGRKQTMDTINSGLRDGMANPRSTPQPRKTAGDQTDNIALHSAVNPKPAAPKPTAIHATPYAWTDPASIPRREWLYGKLLLRKFVSATISPGGIGKSSLIVAETLAMVSGKPLLGVSPNQLLKVWLWNLEDPQEETERKIQAAALHYGLKPDDIGDRLLVDSGRDQRLVIAVTERNGAVIVQPVVDSLVAEIIKRKIDVVIIDPFVSCHEVAENDNPAMDRVVKEWGKVADRGNCAVHLVDHTRKMGDATEVTTESSRGGSAKTDACRVVRVVNRMTEKQAADAGVDNHRLYFRTYNDKGNLQPPADGSDWFKLESVNLGNGPMGLPGDSVGVVTKWDWPDHLAGVTGADFDRAAYAIRSGKWRENVQASDWVGKAIAKALGLHLDNQKERAKVRGLIKAWRAAGNLIEVEGLDDKSKPRKYIEVKEGV